MDKAQRTDRRAGRCRGMILLAALGAIASARAGESGGMDRMATTTIERRTQGDGRWFPAGPRALAGLVSECMAAAAPPAVTGRIVAALAPHAGYVYSGAAAGHTFRALKDQAVRDGAPDTLVILGFTHHVAFTGLALLDGDTLRSPLGAARLDRDAAALLMRNRPRLFSDARPHTGEHSAENLVPFAQAALPDVPLVVGLFGDHDPATLDQALDGLTTLAAQRHIVVLASTDLLHDPDYDTVTRTDRRTLDRLAAMDDAGLRAAWRPDRQLCCGIAPVLTALRFARAQGARAGVVLHYRNSGDDHPESRGQWVVGYGAVAFAAPAPSIHKETAP